MINLKTINLLYVLLIFVHLFVFLTVGVFAAGLSLVVLRGLCPAVAARCGAQALGVWASVVVALGLWRTGSVVVAHGFSYSPACEVFPDQGLNPGPLHCKADS